MQMTRGDTARISYLTPATSLLLIFHHVSRTLLLLLSHDWLSQPWKLTSHSSKLLYRTSTVRPSVHHSLVFRRSCVPCLLHTIQVILAPIAAPQSLTFAPCLLFTPPYRGSPVHPCPERLHGFSLYQKITKSTITKLALSLDLHART